MLSDLVILQSIGLAKTILWRVNVNEIVENILIFFIHRYNNNMYYLFNIFIIYVIKYIYIYS